MPEIPPFVPTATNNFFAQQKGTLIRKTYQRVPFIVLKDFAVFIR